MLLPFTAGPVAIPVWTATAGSRDEERAVDVYADGADLWVANTAQVAAAGPLAGTRIPVGQSFRWQLVKGDTLFAVAAAGGTAGHVDTDPLNPAAVAPQLLGYAESVAQPPAFTRNVFVDVPGLQLSFVAGGRPVIVDAHLPAVSQSIANGQLSVAITDLNGNPYAGCTGQSPNASGSCGAMDPSCLLRGLTPGQVYSFKVQVTCPFNGLATLSASAPGNFPGPMFIRALEAA